MKKNILALSIAAMIGGLGFASSASADPVGYPGSTWSTLTFNPGVIKDTPEQDNLLLQGKIEQGIDWFKFGDDNQWKFNTYASLGYSADRNGLSYNNKLVPAVGMKVSRNFENGVLDIGVQAVHENHFRGVNYGPRSGTGVQLYVSYWFGWDLRK